MDKPGNQQKARSRRKEARPAEIVSAALVLFAERGLAATRLEDVAKAAGIAKGTVYLYFPTKEDLFRAVVRQELLPTLDGLEAAIAAYSGPASGVLHLLFERIAGVMETNLGCIPKLVLAEGGNFPEIAQFYADEVVARGMRVLERVIARGIANGEFRPIESQVLMPVLIGPVLMMLLWRHSIGRHTTITFDHRTVLAAHLGILRRGLAPEPIR